MTPAELQAIRERCNSATPGPWEATDNTEHTVIPKKAGDTIAKYVWRADAKFIAHARTDLPKALDEIERQAKEIERLREELLHIAHCTTLSVANKWAREALEGDE